MLPSSSLAARKQISRSKAVSVSKSQNASLSGTDVDVDADSNGTGNDLGDSSTLSSAAAYFPPLRPRDFLNHKWRPKLSPVHNFTTGILKTINEKRTEKFSKRTRDQCSSRVGMSERARMASTRRVQANRSLRSIILANLGPRSICCRKIV